MTTILCPACDAPILVAASSRWGGQLEAFDPEPGLGDHCDTRLSDDLTHATGAGAAVANLIGKIPLYRKHLWTCPQAMRVPAGKALPAIGGYSHKTSTGWGTIRE